MVPSLGINTDFKNFTMLQINNFSKSYNSKILFNNASFIFERGKIYYIYGENGVGKTTLFRCILGLEAFQGEIKKGSEKQFCVFDSTPFYLNLSGIDNLIILSKNKNIKKQILENDIEFLSVRFLEKVKVKNYSLGEKKMLSLILLVLLKPNIILLDEILNGLDQGNRKLLIHSLRQLRQHSVILLSGHEKLYMDLGDEFLIIKNQSLNKVKEKDLGNLFVRPKGDYDVI